MGQFLRRNALTIVIVLMVTTLAVSALALHDASNTERRASGVATAVASRAEAGALGTLLLVRQDIDAECYRVNYLRWNIDRAAFRSWLRDRATAGFLQASRYRAVRALAHGFRDAAQSDEFLPLTDCTKAGPHPLTYRPPSAIPFDRVPPRVLWAALTTPPPPPK